MKKAFIKFLKKENAYEPFLEALKEDREFTLDKLLAKFDGKSHRIIRGAFIWSKTTEGVDYWSALSKKWQAESIFN